MNRIVEAMSMDGFGPIQISAISGAIKDNGGISLLHGSKELVLSVPAARHPDVCRAVGEAIRNNRPQEVSVPKADSSEQIEYDDRI